MPDLFQPDLIDMRAECQREVEQRQRVYADLVRHRQMNRLTADRRIDIMIKLVALLDRLISERGEHAP